MKAGDAMDDTRLGTLLLENPLTRPEDVERCLEIQALTGGTRPLGEILVEEGVISSAMLADMLALQQSRRAQTRGSAILEDGGPLGFVRAAVAHGASDLIISEGRPVLIRTGGELRELTPAPLPAKEMYEFIVSRMGSGVLPALARHKAATCEFHEPGCARGRIAAFRHFDGLCVTIRLHPEQLRAAAAARIPTELVKAVGHGKGMVIVAGEVRSGLSETLATLLETVAHEARRFVLVLDRDFEGPLPRGGAIVVRRRIGIDTPDYVTALRAAAAQGPDVIFVGDLTEVRAFDLALRAAEGGALVVGGMRARTVVAALERTLNGYPAYDVPRVRTTLAAVINCIAAVHLLPTPTRQGSVLATEVLALNDAAREVVRNGALTQLNLLMRLDSAECGHTLDDSLIELVETESARVQDAFCCADDKTRLLQVAQRETTAKK